MDFSSESQRQTIRVQSTGTSTHVVTGATGFVGSAIVLELLARTENDEVVGIVRVGNGQNPTQRLRQILHPLVDGYGLPKSLVDAIDRRVTAVAGDLEQRHCGVAVQVPGRVEFWHSAASLHYQDRHRKQIERTNVGGTKNALDLANELDTECFNMVSTAYVAGSQRGLIEAEGAGVENVNNLYERSKVEAERAVTASDINYRVLRPGVVVGHSKTRHTTSTDGLYGFVRSLAKFGRILERSQPGLSQRLALTLVTEPQGTIDLVPIDHVAREAVALWQSGAPPDYYHLTNPTPPRIGDTVDAAFKAAGLRVPRQVDDRDLQNETDLKLQTRVDFYASYLNNPKRFDRSNVFQILGEAAEKGFLMDSAVLDSFCEWYVETANLRSAALPTVR